MAQSTKQPHFHLIKSSEVERGEKTGRDPLQLVLLLVLLLQGA